MKVYYEVRGPRAIYREGEDGKRERVGTNPGALLRFESMTLDDAQRFASDVWRREKILCTIDEIERKAA